MGEAILTPDGKVVIVNGAATGMAGYGMPFLPLELLFIAHKKLGNVHNMVGQSNADNPDYQGLVYDPLAPKGKRFSTRMPTSKIARMYHSTATMTSSGEILIAGSNPNA